MPRGRPVKFTPELQAAFCLQLVSGASYETAGEAIGISADTVGHWMSLGRQQTRGKYADFCRAVLKARAEVVQRLLARAQQRVRSKKDGGEGADPLPLLAVIDRRYQPQVRVQVASELDALLDRLETEFANEPETFERILTAIAEETGPGAVASASRGAAREDVDRSEAVRAASAEPSADDVSRNRG